MYFRQHLFRLSSLYKFLHLPRCHFLVFHPNFLLSDSTHTPVCSFWSCIFLRLPLSGSCRQTQTHRQYRHRLE